MPQSYGLEMKAKEFDELVKNRLDVCQEILNLKDDEYSSDTDRLHNFVSAGKMKDETPIKALYGMFVKHLVSFKDIVEKMDNNELYVPEEGLVKEKISDNINYFLLAEGLIEDRRKETYRPNSD